MNLELAENIRLQRKSQRLTQQQLADAMGVTVGAVHKWELGLSTPDIRIIMDLARFFGTSVDGLLGYRMEPREKSQILEALQEIRLKKTYDACWDTVEGWLRQYPNDFDIVFACGNLYQLAGLETSDADLLNRAIMLLEHAVNLSPSEVIATEIYQKIGLSYLDLGLRQKGLDMLLAHNPCGIHDSTIGMELSEDPQQSRQAQAFLSRAMLQALMSLHHIVSGYLSIYFARKDYPQAQLLLQWVESAAEGLELPNTTSFLTKDRAVFLAAAAGVEEALGNRSQALKILRKARKTAQAFDARPDCTTANIRYCQAMDPVSTFDDSGATAAEAVREMLREIGPTALLLWEETEHEK